MSATIYVAEDGNWGSAEPGEFVILYNVNSMSIEQLGQGNDEDRWALAKKLAEEQLEEEDEPLVILRLPSSPSCQCANGCYRCGRQHD